MTNPTDWPLIVSAMQQGGFYDRVMRGGPELDRVKQYLRAFAGAHAAGGGDPNQAPDYPCFPGLTHRPFHDAGGHEGAAMLEAAFPVIRDEALALGDSAQLDYTIASAPARSLRNPLSWLRRRAAPRAWTVYPFYHMGVDVEALALQQFDAGIAFLDRHATLHVAAVVQVVEVDHLADFGQAEAGALGPEDPGKPGAVALGIDARGAPPDRLDQSFFLVEAQRARRDVEFLRKIGDGILVPVAGIRRVDDSVVRSSHGGW